MTRIERRPLGAVLIGGSVILAGLSGRHPWWVSALVAMALLMVVTVRIRGRTIYGWARAGVRYRTGRAVRARERDFVPDVADVEVASGACGIARDGDVLIAVIQLAPNLDLPTVVADSTTYTEDTVAVDTVAGMLDQFGVVVDIDIVTTCRRVREIGNYGQLYDQLIGGHPVVGDRLTWLVVRLDAERNVAQLSRRGSTTGQVARTLATAAIRIGARLRETGIAAEALPADEVRAAIGLLYDGFDITTLKERWGRLVVPNSNTRVVSYGVRLGELGDNVLDDCWAQHTGRTTLTVSLTRESGEDTPYSELSLLRPTAGTGKSVQVRALVRFVGSEVESIRLPWLRPLGGRQSEALLASLPSAALARSVVDGTTLDSEALVKELRIPIGPDGQILGALSGQPQHTLAVPLYDQARYRPQRRVIDAHVNLPVAQQLVLRAAVVGADIEIHTRRPDRWKQLVSAVGDPQSVRFAQNAGNGVAASAESSDYTPPNVAVFDGIAPSATPAHTTIAISDPGSPSRPTAHVTINQIDDNAVNIALPMGTLRVDLIEPMGEARYLDTGPAPALPVATVHATPAPSRSGAGIESAVIAD